MRVFVGLGVSVFGGLFVGGVIVMISLFARISYPSLPNRVFGHNKKYNCICKIMLFT